MNTLKIIQPTSALENDVPASIVSALVSISESINNNNNIQIEGTINISGGVYQDDVDYLTGAAGRFPNFHINASGYYIKIEDSAIQTLCAVKWGDGIGITAALAAAVTSIRESNVSLFKDRTDLIDATFFKYFTGLDLTIDTYGRYAKLVDAFSGCSNLTRIELPSNITILGGSMFKDCTSLSSIDISNVITLANAFSGCSVTLLNTQNVQYIEGTNSQSSRGYSNTELSFPNIKSISGSYGLAGCTNVTKIDLGSGITSIDTGRTFAGDTSLKTVIIRATSVPSWTHGNSSWSGGAGLFSSVPQDFKIYVPDASLSAYTSDSVWSLYSSHFHPLSELPS